MSLHERICKVIRQLKAVERKITDYKRERDDLKEQLHYLRSIERGDAI